MVKPIATDIFTSLLSLAQLSACAERLKYRAAFSLPPAPSHISSAFNAEETGTQDAFQLLRAAPTVISPDSRRTNHYMQTSENLSLRSTLFLSVDNVEQSRSSCHRKEWLMLGLLNLNNKSNSRFF